MSLSLAWQFLHTITESGANALPAIWWRSRHLGSLSVQTMQDLPAHRRADLEIERCLLQQFLQIMIAQPAPLLPLVEMS